MRIYEEGYQVKKLLSSKIVLLVLTIIFTVSFLLTGCGQASGTPKNSTANSRANLSGTVTLSGSTSVQPLAQVLSDEFTANNSGVKVDVQAGGSSTGVKNAGSGASDIGNSSRDLKDEEKSLGIDEHIIAIDGIAVIVNPNNKVADLTKEQIAKIFKKEITNWKDVGGDDKPIVVVSREDGSGTRGAFEELMALIKKEKNAEGKEIEVSQVKYDLIANENGVVKATVQAKDNAIGYMSMGYVDENIKALKVDGVEASFDNIKSKSYALWRPFLMLTKGELRPEVKAFLDYVLSDEGQQVVTEEGYISYKVVK
jgi:phosphate transport system substrate-binding protein